MASQLNKSCSEGVGLRGLQFSDDLQEPLQGNLQRFCQVCEAAEELLDISEDVDAEEELGRVMVIWDSEAQKIMKYLCKKCNLKLGEISEFRKQYMTTYKKVLACIECLETQVVVKLDKIVVTFPEKEAADILGQSVEDSHIEIVPVAENGSEDNRMCTKDTQLDKVSTFTCDYCKKSYKSKGALRTHVIRHLQQEKSKKRTNAAQKGLLKHICAVCGYNAKFRSVLKQHMLIHTGEKPHKCSKCGKSFSFKCALTKHRMIHTGEKPFICGICSTAFRLMHHLKRHMLIHTGQKPHKCTICDKEFTQKGNLNQHMRRLHPKD